MPSTVNRLSALLDLLLIIGGLWGLKTILLQFDAIWSYAGPISLAAILTLSLVLVALRKERLSDIGFKRPRSAFWLLKWTLIVLVATILTGIFASSAATAYFGGPTEATLAIDERYQGRFENVPGNLSAYLFWIALAWGIGGFTEEILFRGFLIHRFGQVYRKIPLGVFVAVLLQGVFFGQQHYYYQGAAGWAATGAIGVVSGLFYVGLNRNLWPLILSHGLSNTVGLTLMYLGLIAA